ncbi:MAG: FtsW/RodA/SpoVE family cell cycle protein [Phycisphaerae bacterium]
MYAQDFANDVDRTGSYHAAGLALIAVALLLSGIVMVASTSTSLDVGLPLWPVWKAPAGRQCIFAVMGMLAMAATYRVAPAVLARPRVARGVAIVLFGVAVTGLLAVWVTSLGAARHGSRRWLGGGPAWMGLAFQPSEFTKLAMVACLAALLGGAERGVSDRTRYPFGADRSPRRRLLAAAIVIAASVGLVGIADFGTAALLGVVGGLVLLVAGCPWRYLLATLGAGVAGLAGLFYLEPYRMKRITSFLHLWDHARDIAYHPVQSLVTIASGGWTGVGLGAGVQQHGYLPESRTDFIFSVICEETGVLGGCLIIALYAAFVWISLRTVLGARSGFERLLAFGVAVTFALQAVMNIAVVTVSAPTTGISLPLVSAGGSGIVCFCAAIGLLGAVARRGGEAGPAPAAQPVP